MSNCIKYTCIKADTHTQINRRHAQYKLMNTEDKHAQCKQLPEKTSHKTSSQL